MNQNPLRPVNVKTFFTVTIPGCKYGLISAGFVVFTLIFTDFGVPKVIGGNFNMLATDIYKQVIGQQNFQMGAVLNMDDQGELAFAAAMAMMIAYTCAGARFLHGLLTRGITLRTQAWRTR